MMRLPARLATDRTGTAAAEMAMSLPLLLVLMFGSFELGYYFLSEHVVQKGVRDAARYGSRLAVNNFDCASSAVLDPALTQIRKVARTGQPDGTTSRLGGWTDDTMTTVTLTCDTSGTYTGLYTDFPTGVPIVTVTAAVPYPSLFGTLGLPDPGLTLNARSQSAVFGA
ncbi:MAG TPA: TadE/TadG family type IV pilus assembly protein [Sphingomicrobium sp.]|nr:TadE/TadG family type IV pilus assembly protein [Sphingomicrobium sp.]